MAEPMHIAPVASWELKAVPSLGALVLRLDFLSDAGQDPSAPTAGRNYVMDARRARELALAILAHCDSLDPGAPSGTRH